MADLLINGEDAYAKYGVSMGNGFLNSLGNPVDMKDDVENESRLEHGKSILIKNRRVASRLFNLEFTIRGETPLDYRTKKKAFLTLLYNGMITVKVPDDSDDVYHILYKGTSQTYAQSRSRCFCKMTLRFEEPNPMNRI